MKSITTCKTMMLHKKLAGRKIITGRKQIIYRANSKANGFYFIETGIVGLYRITESGKEHLIRVYGQGDYFGYRSLFSQENYHLTTRSLIPGEIEHLQVQSVEDLLARAPMLLKQLFSSVCHELGEAENRLSNVAAFEVKIRVIDAITDLFGRFENYPWTSREVAEFAGTETQTVIRVCRQLKQGLFLDPDVRGIRPLNIPALEQLRANLVTA